MRGMEPARLRGRPRDIGCTGGDGGLLKAEPKDATEAGESRLSKPYVEARGSEPARGIELARGDDMARGLEGGPSPYRPTTLRPNDPLPR